MATLAAVSGCSSLAGSPPAAAKLDTPAAGGAQGAVVYYSDGKTVLGTFGADGRPAAPGADRWAPYLMTQVANELTFLDHVSQQQLETGGLRVVTAVSRPLEVKLYQAVDENLSAASLKSAPGATVAALPSWVMVGAELQDPKTGQIVAEYPGQGQDMPAAQCEAAECDVNTAAYFRAQAGSAFKPYVLATAVSEGLNVKTSTLNASPELCIPPDTQPLAASQVVPYWTTKCPQPGYYPVSNDGGEVIGAAGTGGAATVQDALAQSSNTAFSDLAHRVGTARIAAMAEQLGVNTAPYREGGSGLKGYEGDVGLALGIAPLTVNEQAEMLATITDDGLYHQAHVVRYWQAGPAGAPQRPKFAAHAVLSPGQDAQVQYAMEGTTANGTAAATVTFGQRAPGTVIGKTGGTAGAHSGFFLGATTQYALVVGLFTSTPQPGPGKSLTVLGGGGFGSYWPAKIWNTFAESAFAKTPAAFPTSPAFAGADWNQVG